MAKHPVISKLNFLSLFLSVTKMSYHETRKKRRKVSIVNLHNHGRVKTPKLGGIRVVQSVPVDEVFIDGKAVVSRDNLTGNKTGNREYFKYLP